MSELPCLSCANDWSCANCPGVKKLYIERFENEDTSS